MRIAYDLSGVEEHYRPLIIKAIEHMEEVVTHATFLEALRDEISNSNELEGELSGWKSSTPEVIYKQLFPIILLLRTYWSIKNVIGFGYANDKRIFLNTKYLGKYSVDNLEHVMLVGSNLLHEHSHDCGFEHDHHVTDRRKNSISYILNRAYERTFREIYNVSVKPPRAHVPWWRRIFKWLF